MDQLLAVARGPLFIMTFTFMILALLRLAAIQTVGMIMTWLNTRNRELNPGEMGKSILDWLIPARHVLQARPLFSLTSMLWHATMIVTPLAYIGHTLLWGRGLGLPFAMPGIDRHLADLLTIITVALTAVLFAYRALSKEARALSEPMDYILMAAIALPFISGFLIAHPGINPIGHNLTLLVHILSAELVFVLMPLTKLAHVVLFPFGRIAGDIYWRFPEGSGDKIASELFGEEAKV